MKLSDPLSVSIAATQTYKKALTAVQTNISNLNTEGYSRIEAKVSESGMGAGIATVTRSADAFAEKTLRSASSALAFEKPATDYANRILNLVGSESSSLSSAFDRFFSSSNQLATNPSSEPLRQDFLSSSTFLAARVKSMATELQDIVIDNNAEVEHRIDELNGFSSQLSAVNKQLLAFTGEPPPPSLLDKRDLILMKMSKLAKIDASYDANGLASVTLSDPNQSVNLVSKLEVYNLGVEPQPQVIDFGALTANQTLSIGGITITAGGSGATAAEVAGAFDSLANGASGDATGANIASATGTLTGFTTSAITNTDQVTFTRVAGSSATLSKSGTGASATFFSGEKNTQKVVDALGNEISTFSGGTIGGLISAKASVVTPLVTNLNTLTNTFVTRANSQHKSGVNASGVIGGDLFTTGAGTNYAENMAVALSNTNEIAASGRLYIIPAASNSSEINTSLTYGHNDSWDGSIEAEFTINFTSATAYTITQGGSSTNYTGFDQAIGITFGDVKISFDSAPATGHSFTISPNTTGRGDNNNITELSNISSETIFSGKTLREYYINEVGKVATFNDLSKMSTEAKQVVFDSAMTAKDQVSGVNLDEEAAELVRLQQAYLASARAMQVSNKIFEELMRVAF